MTPFTIKQFLLNIFTSSKTTEEFYAIQHRFSNSERIVFFRFRVGFS